MAEIFGGDLWADLLADLWLIQGECTQADIGQVVYSDRRHPRHPTFRGLGKEFAKHRKHGRDEVAHRRRPEWRGRMKKSDRAGRLPV